MEWDFDKEFVPDSSFVNWVGYDSKAQVLAVELARGKTTYHFANVPYATYLVFKYQDEDVHGSVGEYFNSYIKPTFPEPGQE